MTLKSYTDTKTVGVVTLEQKWTESTDAAATTKLGNVEKVWEAAVSLATYYTDDGTNKMYSTSTPTPTKAAISSGTAATGASAVAALGAALALTAAF